MEAPALQKVISLLTGTLLCGVCTAIDMADMEVYVDYPVGLWDFVSDGTVDTLNTDRVHSYEHSVRHDLNAGQHATMYHTWSGEYTQDVLSLGFWIYSDSANVRDIRFSARIRGEAPRPEIRLGDFATISVGNWSYVELPLQAFFVNPGEILHYTYFRSPNNLTFWLDDIKLLTRPPLSLTTIVVDPTIIKFTLSAKSFGVGINARDRAFEEEPGTWALMRDAGLTFMNFPGGINADMYDWRTSLSTFDGSLYRVNTDDYIRTAGFINSEMMITTNYGSATPQDSADWVEYANIGRGANIKYWSIGNECYHPGEYDIRPAPFHHDAETYAIFCVEAIQLMKAVDPTIKIGVVATYNERSFPQRITVINPRTGEEANGWSAVLLTTMRELGVLPDYFDFHLYTMAPGRESDSVAFQMIDRLDFWTEGMRQMLSDYLGEAAEGIDLHLVESNSVWGEPGKMSVSLTSALYAAHQWGAMNVRNVKSHIWWKLHDEYRETGNYHEAIYGWRQHSDSGILGSAWPVGSPVPLNAPYPAYYALRMINEFADPGDQIIECETENMLLKTYAVRSPGGRIRLMVINISKDTDWDALVNVAGMLPPQFVTVHRYGKPQDLAESDFTTEIGYGGGTIFGETGPRGFVARFNRYSITIIEF
ncbi:MAG: hypothetical protein M3R13_11150 [Armatimonadota bacterium]|nr:hypothetical protein [Armatimonadota bacterium]